MTRWPHCHHMADIGAHGPGATQAEAVEQSARAMTRGEVASAAPDPELLPVNWLNAWVFEMAVHHMPSSLLHGTLTDGGLRGFGWGASLDWIRP